MNVISSKPVALEEANELLAARKKEGELDYVQEQALEYSEKFSDSSRKEKAKKVFEELKEKKIPLNTAIKIVEIWPKNADTLRLILAKERVELSEEEFNSVLEKLSK